MKENEGDEPGGTPRTMSSEWCHNKLILPLSRAGLYSAQIEELLRTKGAMTRWVASIPQHIADAKAVQEKQRLAKEKQKAEAEKARLEALVIKDESAPIEDLDLSVRTYNTLKRAELHTVADVLASTSKPAEREDIFGPSKLAAELRQRLIDDGKLDPQKVPAWIHRKFPERL